MWRLGSQCMIGTGLPEPSLSINSSSHPPWQACPFPIQCCLLLLGNPVLVWVPALWPFSPSLLVGHTVGAFFGYHTLSEILSSLSSRSLRKKVDGHSILNPCSTSRMPRGSLTARQRFPEHSELLLPSSHPPARWASGESFDERTLTFLNIPKEAQYLHWLSLPSRHWLIHLQRACLERKLKKQREKGERMMLVAQ